MLRMVGGSRKRASGGSLAVGGSPRRHTADVRRWLAGHRAAAAANRALAAKEGADSHWSARLAVTMIAAAESAGLWPPAADEVRQRGVARVRRTWDRLRLVMGDRWRNDPGRRAS